ncbi:hypothetical protein MTR_2g045305 [Medicago truncatula]|uniref:Uncharacterized protein n=1 Tax=Medicago truncatula TaxID=3880 RepID=A0A072VHS5_MEDTR|nr:hypothetical protein MTR_2g045305 [Medicago truncatula]
MSTRRYGMRGPVISNDMHKQTSLRVLLHKIQLLIELLDFQIQITGHPLLLNPNTWSLSQLQDFQSIYACLNYAF